MPIIRSKKLFALILVTLLPYATASMACSPSSIKEDSVKILPSNTSVFAAINAENSSLAVLKVESDFSVSNLWATSLVGSENSNSKFYVTSNGLCVIEESGKLLPKISGEEVGVVFYCNGGVEKVYKVKDLVNLKEKELAEQKVPENTCGPALYQWKNESQYTGSQFRVDVVGNKSIYFNPYDGEIICTQENSIYKNCQAKSLSKFATLINYQQFYQFSEKSSIPEIIEQELIKSISRFLIGAGESLVINAKSDDTDSMEENKKIAKSRAMYFYNLFVSYGVPEAQLSIRLSVSANKAQGKAKYVSKDSMRRVVFLEN